LIAELKGKNQGLLNKLENTIASMNAKHLKDTTELGDKLKRSQEDSATSDASNGKFIADLQG